MRGAWGVRYGRADSPDPDERAGPPDRPGYCFGRRGPKCGRPRTAAQQEIRKGYLAPAYRREERPEVLGAPHNSRRRVSPGCLPLGLEEAKIKLPVADKVAQKRNATRTGE